MPQAWRRKEPRIDVTEKQHFDLIVRSATAIDATDFQNPTRPVTGIHAVIVASRWDFIRGLRSNSVRGERRSSACAPNRTAHSDPVRSVIECNAI